MGFLLIQMQTTSGRKQRMQINLHRTKKNLLDDDVHLVTNISATKDNRSRLQDTIKIWESLDHYASLELWEFIARVMPGWRIMVITQHSDTIFINS